MIVCLINYKKRNIKYLLEKDDDSTKKNIDFFVASTRDQKLSSEVSDYIPDLPDTHIKENDIYNWILRRKNNYKTLDKIEYIFYYCSNHIYHCYTFIFLIFNIIIKS